MKKIVLFATLVLISTGAMSKEIQLYCEYGPKDNPEGYNETFRFDPELNTLNGHKNGETSDSITYQISSTELVMRGEHIEAKRINRVSGEFKFGDKDPWRGHCTPLKQAF